MRGPLIAFGLLLALSALPLAQVLAYEGRVALIADPGGRDEAQGARDYFALMEGILKRVDLPYAVVTQDQILAGVLDDYRIAIIPYAPNLSRAARALVKSFCSDGGKVMCFYTTYGLDSELRVASTTYVPDPERKTFCYVRCRRDALPRLPEGFAQVSWNISAPRPARDAMVLADWLDANGEETGRAAATLSDGGLYFSHVLLAEGEENQRNAGLMLKRAVEYLKPRVGQRRDIAIVYGTLSEATERGDGRLVGRMVGEMQRILDAAGVPYAVVTDEAVARGALRGRRVAILPLNFEVSDEEAKALQDFVAAGGRLIGCFSVASRLHALMGVATGQFKAGGAASPFEVVKFNATAPDSFPDSFGQRSSNIIAVTAAPDGEVIATWHDSNGADTGYPAVILSPTGMYFSYILHAGDVAKTSAFLMAAVAELAGQDVYRFPVEHLTETLWDFRRYTDRESMRKACAGNARALEALDTAVSLESNARRQAASGQLYEAYQALQNARGAADLAFIRSLPSRGGREFRGAWIHNVSVPDQDWDAFFAGMKQRHLNALLPNVCAAGYAHYQSDLLPLSSFVRENGPQMENMLAAAKKHGIEVHLWRVNYNLWWPGNEVVDELAAQERVCRDPEGNIVGGGNASLCPSHPENQRLEIEAMLEMTRKFHPDGIHFDYIRYPGGQACYCNGCRKRFESRIGQKVQNWPADVLSNGPLAQQYLDFRRDQITHVVAEVSRRSREIDPNVKVSAAVFSYWDSARDSIGQDWRTWVEEGYLDFVCPMNYTQSPEELSSTVTQQRGWVGADFPLQSGIGAFRSSSAWHTADLVDSARRSGADGLVFFDYRGRVVTDFVPALLEGPLREQARTPWAK